MGGVASADVEVRCPSAWHPVSAYGEIPMSVVRPVGRDHPATVAPSLAATFAATAAAFASAVAPRSASAAFSALVGRTRRRITASDAGQNEIPETAPIG